MPRTRSGAIHPAWIVALVTTVTLLAASAFRSSTGVLIQPIMDDTGWSMETISGAAALNLVLYGIATPFTAAIMQTWGVRRTVVVSMVVVGLASAATTLITAPWQLWLLWGVFIGLGTGALALTFGAIVANRWFAQQRNLVTGIFSAASAAGQVLFVPVIAHVAASSSWRAGPIIIAGVAGIAALACALLLRDRPEDLGVAPYGAEEQAAPDSPAVADRVPDSPDASALSGEQAVAVASQSASPRSATAAAPTPPSESPLTATLRVLRTSAARWPFWVLLATFFICGWSTNGIVVTHLVPAAHDHAMPATTAASIVGVIGMFDVIGTIASGWLTDRIDPRLLLAFYYVTRGISLIFIHSLLAPGASLPLWAWVVFYGLDWTATVPPTVDLCRRHFGITDSGIVFGWVYAAHMVGAGIGAQVSGVLRSHHGTYEWAWMLTAALCVLVAVLPLTIRLGGDPGDVPRWHRRRSIPA